MGSLPIDGQGQQTPQIAGNLPEIYQNGSAQLRLEKYCDTFGVDKEEVKTLLCVAEQLIGKLHGGETPQAEPKAMRALMWYAMAQAAAIDVPKSEHGQLFISGSFRIDDPEGKLHSFFKECGDKDEHPCYPRISSHMKQEAIGKQHGIDFNKGELPADKTSVLFSQVKDPVSGTKTLFFKMEAHGCPPFWKSGFRTLKNFTTFCLHSITFILTRFKPSGTKDAYKARKEHVPKEVKHTYIAVMGLEQKPGIVTRITSLFSRLNPATDVLIKEAQALAKGALASGISAMIPALQDRLHETPAGPKRDEMEQLLDTLIERRKEARALGYKGDIKGNEVLLPPWTSALYE